MMLYLPFCEAFLYARDDEAPFKFPSRDGVWIVRMAIPVGCVLRSRRFWRFLFGLKGALLVFILYVSLVALG